MRCGHWCVCGATGRKSAGRYPDPYAQARQLVGDKSIVVPEIFTTDDLEAARTAAVSDPRLAAALQNAQHGHISQYLTGVPALLKCYETAAPAAKALIEAAMDALHLVPGVPLTNALLEEAAEGHLTAAQLEQLDDRWFDETLASLPSTLRGTRGALTRVRPRRGQPASA